MNRITMAAMVAAFALASLGCGSTRYSQHAQERYADEDTIAVMTKQDVITLSQAKVGDDVIISQMKASRATFQLTTQDIIDLTDAGVSDKVIEAMILTDNSSRSAERQARYHYYPPYYWYAGYPYFYSWYPSFYRGYTVVYNRPLFGYHRGHGARGFGGRR